jgi:hypothetical protein
MVNAILWTNGKIRAEELRQRFEAAELPILKMRLETKFGLQIWRYPNPSDSDSLPFNIRNYIIEGPRKYQGTLLNDNSGFQGQKSSLQMYLTHWISRGVDWEARPPWEILVIPQPSSSNKERTCCLLRFHALLLKYPEVQGLLDDIFSQNVVQLEPSPEISGECFSLEQRYERLLTLQDLDEPVRIIEEFGQNTFRNCELWFKSVSIRT